MTYASKRWLTILGWKSKLMIAVCIGSMGIVLHSLHLKNCGTTQKLESIYNIPPPNFNYMHRHHVLTGLVEANVPIGLVEVSFPC